MLIIQSIQWKASEVCFDMSIHCLNKTKNTYFLAILFNMLPLYNIRQSSDASNWVSVSQTHYHKAWHERMCIDGPCHNFQSQAMVHMHFVVIITAFVKHVRHETIQYMHRKKQNWGHAEQYTPWRSLREWFKRQDHVIVSETWLQSLST